MDAGKAQVGALASDLLADPCAFLAAEHGRQRALLGHLERLARHARGATQPALAKALVGWLACELPLHLTDEAESLMPRLASAAPALSVRLGAEDLALRDLRQKVRDALAPIAAGHAAPDDFAATAQAFAQLYRQRLATEEAEVLPVARLVLDESARHAIAAEMRQRRN
jgi:hemerythrin-like domain-containing protein